MRGKLIWYPMLYFSLILVSNGFSQTIISETMEIGNIRKTLPPIATSHNSGPGGREEAGIILREGGMLKLYADYAARYLSEIQPDAHFEIRIMGVRDSVFQMPASYFFKDPLVTPTNDFCSDGWYLYGKGSHFFTTGYRRGFDDTYITNYKTNEIDLSDMNFGTLSGISVRNEKRSSPVYTLQNQGFLRFTIPTIPWSKIDVTGHLSRLQLQITSFGIDDERYFEVVPVTSGWSEHSITYNNKPGILDSLVIKKKGKDRSKPVIHQPGYYFLHLKDYLKYWLSGNANNGIRLAFPETNETDYVTFYASEKGRYGAPVFNMGFDYPAGEPAVEPLDIMQVAAGDTVLISYVSGGRKMEWGRSLSKRNIRVKETLLKGYPFQFWETRDSGALCGLSRYITDRANGVVFTENTPVVELQLQLPEPKEIWPTIPSDGANSNFGFSVVENIMEDITVSVTKDGKPMQDQAVTISTSWIEGSGGHNHEGGNDILSPPGDRMGWIINIANGDSSRSELTAYTNMEGEVKLNYRAPEFGGEIAIEATTANGNAEPVTAEDVITVKVPGLVLLPDGDNYSKVGGTPSHRGPRVDQIFENFREPDNNHYVTVAFRDSLIAIADAWADLVASDSTLDNRQSPLNINDISLPNGGKFDVFGSWNPPHSTHRVGRDADIRTTRGLPIGRNRNGVLLTSVMINGRERFRNRKFENICVDKGANPLPRIHDEGQPEEHYHLYFY